MKREKVIVIVCALLLGVFLFRGVFSSSDEKAIERVVDLIEHELEFNQPLKPLDIAGRLNNLKGLIDQDIDIEVQLDSGNRSWSGFDSVKAGALAGSRMIKTSSIHRLPTDIEVKGSEASTRFQVIGSGVDASGDTFRERVQVTARFEKHNGDWILKAIKVFRDSTE